MLIFFYLEYCDGNVCKNNENLKENFPFENSNTLTDLLDSIKNIAKSFEQPLNNDFGDGLAYSSTKLSSQTKLDQNLLKDRIPLKLKVEQNEELNRPMRNTLKNREGHFLQRRGRESSVQPILHRLTMLAKGVTDIQQKTPLRRDHSAQPTVFREVKNNNNTENPITNNWSNSFFKAANFIVDKLNNTVIANEFETRLAKEQHQSSINIETFSEDSNKNSLNIETEESNKNLSMTSLKDQICKNLISLKKNSQSEVIYMDQTYYNTSDLQNLNFPLNVKSEKVYLQTNEDKTPVSQLRFEPFSAENYFENQIKSNESNIDTTKNIIELETSMEKDLKLKKTGSQARFYHHDGKIGNNILEPREGRRRFREKSKRVGSNFKEDDNLKAAALPPLLPNKIKQIQSDGINLENQLKSDLKKSLSMNGELYVYSL